MSGTQETIGRTGCAFATSNTPQGKLVQKAVIYSQQEHRIPPESIDPDAVRIIRRLQRAGHTAYIVGGACATC
jgi:poly(A) polymerase